MILDVLYALGAIAFVLGIGLAIAFTATEIRAAADDAGRPDYPFDLENHHEDR